MLLNYYNAFKKPNVAQSRLKGARYRKNIAARLNTTIFLRPAVTNHSRIGFHLTLFIRRVFSLENIRRRNDK